MPGSLKLEAMRSHPGSAERQGLIQTNNQTSDLQASSFRSGDALLRFYGVGPNSLTAPLGIGSTDTQVGTAAFTMSILGVPVVKAVSGAGTTFGALGTIPAATWGVIAIDAVAAGTITYASGAANYTTGYTTEALAIAALPPRITAKARIGYLTILAPGGGWVAATNSLAGGATTPATTTNYYPYVGIDGATGTAVNSNGVICSAGQGVQGGAAAVGSGIAWTGGRNGVLIATALTLGSTTTNVATTAFTYNANGLCDIPKAAVTVGTLLTGGTIPADKWGIFVMLINGAGTITYVAGPSNTVTGYATEPQAIADLANIFPTAGLCQIGYITVKTKAATAFIAGTDGLAGGAVGNIASATNYYPTAGITYAAGQQSSLIANRSGVVVNAAQY